MERDSRIKKNEMPSPSQPRPFDRPTSKAVKHKFLSATNQKPHILLVEDFPTLQYTGTEFLQMLGCDVTVATTGIEATTLFKNNK